MHVRRFGFARPLCSSRPPNPTYDAAVSIPGDLERARHLAFADDETAAKELLLALMPQVELADRDDQMLEVLAQLGELYLVRTAYDGVREAVRRIRDCLGTYSSILDGTATPEVVAHSRLNDAEARHMTCRYSRRAQFLEAGLAAAMGDHDGAAAAISRLDGMDSEFADLSDEFDYLKTYGRLVCATALCDDDMYVRSGPLWQRVVDDIGEVSVGSEAADRLWVNGALGYARFCIETGRREEAEPWLRRAGARADARGWELATARTQLERATASWTIGDHLSTEHLVTEAYKVIHRYARANDVSRCWLYMGLTRLAAGGLQAADQCWEYAERHWRELGKPLHIHRILLQRSWIAILRGRYQDAIDMVEQARSCLDASPRSSWLAYARLDDHLGTVWRADALADLGFDGAGDPDEDWTEAEARYRKSLGVTSAETGSPKHRSGLAKLAKAAELKVPAALAVDSVRYSIADVEARSQWAACVSARLLAGAFAVAWESENHELVGALVEYHSARGTFSTDLPADGGIEFSRVATAPAPMVDADELAMVAGGPSVGHGRSLTRLGPLPPLQMDPTGGPLLAEYRELARQRYGQHVTAAEAPWSTWP
jgi:tetratricopeptide (TPR) repeat protein